MTPPHVAMGEGSEFDAIRRMLTIWGDGARGIGDDAAVVSIAPGMQMVASTDASIEDVHFRRAWLTPDEIAGRATAAALSDLAAMAAEPVGLLLALVLPASWRDALDDIARGVGRVAREAGCPIIGGNVAAGELLSLTITVLGQARQPLMRGGARAGDVLYVTGILGGPAAAVRAYEAGAAPALEYRERFAAPRPRIAEAQWLAARGATSAIDISDGLLADASHVARASEVSVEVGADLIPTAPGVSAADAAVSGEEYELLVTAGAPFDTAAFAREFGIPLTRIGRVIARTDAAVQVTGASVTGATGHDHLN